MKKHLAWLCACGVCWLMVHGAVADVTNGSFELPAVSNEAGGVVPDGWTSTNPGGIYLDPGQYIPDPPDGRQAVEVKLFEIWQNTGMIVNPGETIQIRLSSYDKYNNSVKCVNFYAASTADAGDKGTLIETHELSPCRQHWGQETYVCIPGQSTSFYLVIGLGETGGGWVEFDKVSVKVPAECAAPIFSPAGPNIFGTNQVAINCETPGASIYYTLNGDTPTVTSTEYTGGTISVKAGDVLQAIAVANGYQTSPVTRQTYVNSTDVTNGSFESPAVDRETAGATPDGWTSTGEAWLDPGSYIANPPDGNQAVEVNSFEIWQNTGIVVNPGEAIQISVFTNDAYTTVVKYVNLYAADTFDLGNKGTLLNSHQLSQSVHVWTQDTFTYASNEATPFYLVIGLQEAGGGWCEFDKVSVTALKCDTPVFSPAGSGPTDITINCGTAGASIYYTLNGTTPSAQNGILYNGPVTVHGGDTLQAIAVKSGYKDSVVTSQTYTSPPAAAPVFLPGGPYISCPTKITITCSTAGASIYYTTDGTTPTSSSTHYTGAVTVSNGTTLKAIAVADNYANSDVATMSYSAPSRYNRPEVIESGTATVDGNLSDWSGATWAPLNQTYDGAGATDVPEAYYAARWQAHKVYVAVKVRDTAHSFTDTYGDWNTRDAVEIYLRSDSSGDITYANWTTAQQYIVGIKKSDHTKVWTAIGGNNVATSLDGSSVAGIGSAAGSVDGEWIYYEVEMTPFTYLGIAATGDLSTSTVSTLDVGDVIGLDVCVVGNNAGSYTGMKSENMMTGKSANWEKFGLHKLVPAESLAVMDRVPDGTYSATGSSSPALVYGQPISTVNWISAGVGSRTFDLTTPKYNMVVTGTVTGLTGESVGGSGGWMSLGLMNKHYLDGLAIGQDPGVTYASGQYGFGVNGGFSIVGSDVNHSANDAVVNIHDGWPNQTSDTHLGTNAFDFKVIYTFLEGNTRDTRSIRAYWKPAGSDGWICLGTQNTLGYPLNATFTSGRSDYYLADQWNESQVGVMVTHDAAGQTASISIANMKLAYENVQPGDANFDNAVDVSDLGILAANYGKTSGATWDLGDFNGDGAVDVSDLGILAANYGRNAGSADFNADYAKVFGTAADETAASEKADVKGENPLCGSLGLSLIAGLMMMGLMIVKLEE